MATIKFTNYLKLKNGQVAEQTEFFDVNEVINPKTFLENIASNMDIYSFTEENPVFEDILIECVELFLSGWQIENWEEKTKGMDINQQSYFLLETLTNKEHPVQDLRQTLTHREAKSINRISKIITANFNILLNDLVFQKQQSANVLNSNPNKMMFDLNTKKLIETDQKIDILIDAFNKSRECYYMPKPKFSLFSKQEDSLAQVPRQ